MSNLVLYEVRGLACRITLNRPEKHNCIDIPMLRLLDETLARAANDDAAKVIIICGAGKKAFSSGADLKAFGALSTAEIPYWIRLGNAILNRLSTLPKPTVAAIQGYAYGGGLEVALACDFRIATPNAKFSSPELQRGWVPGWGGFPRLCRLLGEAKAKEIAFMGGVIDGCEAARIGLVTKLVPTESLEAEVQNLVQRLAAINPICFGATKSMFPGSEVNGTDIEIQVAATLIARGAEKKGRASLRVGPATDKNQERG